jgi:hypothetical protein
MTPATVDALFYGFTVGLVFGSSVATVWWLRLAQHERKAHARRQATIRRIEEMRRQQ